MKMIRILLVGCILLSVYLFIVKGVTLTSYYSAICAIMLCVLSWLKGKRQMIYQPILLVPIVLSAGLSLYCLHKLFHPDYSVMSNADHHLLCHVGYRFEKTECSLTGEDGAIFANTRLCKTRISFGQGHAVLKMNSCIPVYSRIKKPFTTGYGLTKQIQVDSLLNQSDLFYTDDGIIELRFHRDERMVIQVSSQDETTTFECSFFKKGKAIDNHQTFKRNFIIRHSLPLDVSLRGLHIPDSIHLDFDLLHGITLLRSLGGAPADALPDDGFFVSISEYASHSVDEIVTSSGTYNKQDLLRNNELILPMHQTIRIGTGVDASPYFSLEQKSDTCCIFLDTPVRRRLEAEREHEPVDLYVVADYQSLLYAESSNALTFPSPSPMEFRLTYLPGSVGHALFPKIIPVGETVVNSPSGNLVAGDTLYVCRKHASVSNIITFRDQSIDAPFQEHLAYSIIYLLLFIAVLSWFAGKGKREYRAEVLAYIFLMGLLTARSFLAWRISIHPPLEMSNTVFENFVSNKYVYWGTLGMIFGIGFLTIGFKMFGAKLKPYCEWMSLKCHSILFPVAAVALLILGYFAKPIVGERMIYVLMPFVIIHAVEIVFALRKNLSFSLARLATHLIAIIYALYFDTGAGLVLLLTDMLFFSLVLLGINRLKQYVGFCLFFLFLGILFGGNLLVVALYKYQYWVLATITFVLIAISVFAVNKFKFRGKVYTGIILFVTLCCMWVAVPKFLQTHPHIYYRSAVHVTEPAEIIMEHTMNSSDMRRLMQNLENQWYLSFHNQQITEDKPFVLRPHFAQAVSYPTQITDCVVVRYVIAEHGFSIIYFIFISLLLLIAAIDTINCRDKSRVQIASHVVVFLFTQSLLILLALTNRFLFFGQDFMMLSLASFLTLIVTGLIVSVYITCSSYPLSESEDYPSSFSLRLVRALLLFVVAIGVLSADPSLRTSRPYCVKESIQKAENELHFVNVRLRRFQLENGYVFSEAPNDIYDIMNKFEHETHTLVELEKLSANGEVSPFTVSLYRNFLIGSSRNNSSDQILHAKLSLNRLELATNKTYYTITPPESKLTGWKKNIVANVSTRRGSQLQIEDGTRRVSVPVEAGKRLLQQTTLSYDYPLFLAAVPGEWLVSGDMRLIAAPRSVELTLSSPTSSITISPNKVRYFAIDPTDELRTQRDATHVLNRTGSLKLIPEEKNPFLARLMNVNGSSKWVYPLGSSFLLPRHLVQMYSNRTAVEDVVLSINLPLQNKIYGILSSFSSFSQEPAHRSVIVANGNGHIKAMVSASNSYRYKQVDPNNEESIREMIDDYYLRGDYQAEEEAFHDMNFQYIYPGSTIKPLIAAGMLLSVPELADLELVLDPSQQQLSRESDNKYIVSEQYAGQRLRFKSLYGDEIGINGRTTMKHYITKSSNYYNSVLVYLGFYKTGYLKQQLSLLLAGERTELFKKVHSGIPDFPQFSLGGNRITFNHWLGDDPYSTHENGALQVGLAQMGLSSQFPSNESIAQKDLLRNIYPQIEDGDISHLSSYHPYAFPRASYLPEAVRITRQGLKDGLKGTSLGSYPFYVTPWKMCELYNRFFSQNAALHLSFDESYQSGEKKFSIQNVENYTRALKEQLLPGMREVAYTGTASKLRPLSMKCEGLGLTLYAKTGTISMGGEGSVVPESQMLAVIVKKSYQSGDDFLTWMKEAPQFVFYFVSDRGKHDYSRVSNVIETVLSNKECKQYLEGKQ